MQSMLNLDTGKSVGSSIKFDHRASSLHRALDINNIPSLNKVKPSHKNSLSFHNFRFIPLVSQINSTMQSPQSQTRQTSPTFEAITSSLPKVSPQNHFRGSLASTISPKMSKALNGADADVFFYNIIKKPMKPTLSQTTIKAAHNRSVSDYSKTKIVSPDVSIINQSIAKGDPMTSMNVSQKKISIIEEKQLPLKRRGLNQDLREAYRNIINSKDHGNFNNVIPKLTEKEKSKSPPRPRMKTEYMFEKNLEMERKEAEKEDIRAMEEINKKAVNDFQRKINLYNLTKGSYIVNPDEKANSARNVGKIKRLANSTTKPTASPKLSFQAILPKRSSIPPFTGLSPPKYYYYIEQPPQTQKAHYTSPSQPLLKPEKVNNNQAKEEKSVNQDTSIDEGEMKEEKSEDKKKGIGTVRSDDMAAISPLFKMKSDPEDKRAADFDLQKIRSLADLIPKKRILNKDEETFFKMIKDGEEYDVQSTLEVQPDLVKILDNRNETPLHWAVKRGHFNIVVSLCKHGADIFALDMAGRNAIDIATRLGTMEILEYLTLHKKKKNEEILVN